MPSPRDFLILDSIFILIFIFIWEICNKKIIVFRYFS